MATGHPTDELGRAIPDAAWPADKAAPGGWDLVRRFCNTRNRESGADRFETAAGVERWLHDEGFAGGVGGDADRQRLIRFREQVRSRARAHHDGTATDHIDAAIAGELTDIELRFRVTDGALDIAPAPGDPVDEVIGRVAIAIMGAQREGCWDRFKACRHCEWVFYDRSKNRSGRWCSMSACGGRNKVAAYRSRARATGGDA